MRVRLSCGKNAFPIKHPERHYADEHHELVVGIAGYNLENPHKNTTFAPSPVPSVNSLPMFTLQCWMSWAGD
jgi:hypothetical protein